VGVIVVGVGHRTAPVEVRERIAFRPAELAAAVADIRARAGATEGVVLSTCNRTEFYLVEGDRPAAPAVWELLSERLGSDASVHGYTERDDRVVSHLFHVTAGLDSMVLGEAQIHGQVRDAWERCRGESGAVLNRLFQTSLLVAGRVRSETSIGRGAASVSSAAVQLAKQIFGALTGRRAMILGAGDMAELALECLTNEGVRAAIVANRTIDRAQALAERFGATAIGYDEGWSLLAEVDLLLCSTASPRPFVTPAHVRPALAVRGDRPLCILDIALPRDVEPSVGELENVFLYNLDDLQAVVAANVRRRHEELPTAEQLIAGETSRFMNWLAGLSVVPVLTRFRSGMEELRARELADALRRMPDLTPAQRAQVEQFSRALMNKFLHQPTVRLRAAAAGSPGLGVVEALRYLFALDDAHHDDAGGSAPAATDGEER
jgi:glutamyl-tRNA reductase